MSILLWVLCESGKPAKRAPNLFLSQIGCFDACIKYIKRNTHDFDWHQIYLSHTQTKQRKKRSISRTYCRIPRATVILDTFDDNMSTYGVQKTNRKPCYCRIMCFVCAVRLISKFENSYSYTFYLIVEMIFFLLLLLVIRHNMCTKYNKFSHRTT